MGSQIPSVKCTFFFFFFFFDCYREASKQNSNPLITLITTEAPKAHSFIETVFWSNGKDLPCLKAMAATARFMVPSAGTVSRSSLELVLYNLALNWTYAFPANWLISYKVVLLTPCCFETLSGVSWVKSEMGPCTQRAERDWRKEVTTSGW